MKTIVAAILMLTPALGFAGHETCSAAPIKIAVIDTGFYFHDLGKQVKLCKYGHKDFTNLKATVAKDTLPTKDLVPIDNHGHGTHVATLIDEYAKKTGIDYCLVILKYFDPLAKSSAPAATVKAINYARGLKVDIINYSGGGIEENKDENEAVKRFLDKGGIFVAAAGNERNNLDLIPYYPAMADPRVLVVGSNDHIDMSKFSRIPSSEPSTSPSPSASPEASPTPDDEDEPDTMVAIIDAVKKEGGSRYSKSLSRTVTLDKNENLIVVSSFSDYGTRIDRWEEGETVKANGILMRGTSQAAAIATGKIVGEQFEDCDIR